MSILISGDFHANTQNELSLITKSTLVKKFKQEKFDEITYHIILGDAGFLWPGNYKTDIFNYKTLANRPFPILCVIGNHEPILGMREMPEIDIGIGEKVIPVNEKNPFIAYLKRGKVYKIDGHKFLALGGALSIDKEYRQPGKSWWEEEYWSKDEKSQIFKLLEKENEFDYILTHTGPNRINLKICRSLGIGLSTKFYDEVADLNEKIDEAITCKQWFCGHWHQDIYHYDDLLKRGYQYLYKKTALLEPDEITVI